MNEDKVREISNRIGIPPAELNWRAYRQLAYHFADDDEEVDRLHTDLVESVGTQLDAEGVPAAEETTAKASPSPSPAVNMAAVGRPVQRINEEEVNVGAGSFDAHLEAKDAKTEEEKETSNREPPKTADGEEVRVGSGSYDAWQDSDSARRFRAGLERIKKRDDPNQKRYIDY